MSENPKKRKIIIKKTKVRVLKVKKTKKNPTSDILHTSHTLPLLTLNNEEVKNLGNEMSKQNEMALQNEMAKQNEMALQNDIDDIDVIDVIDDDVDIDDDVVIDNDNITGNKENDNNQDNDQENDDNQDNGDIDMDEEFVGDDTNDSLNNKELAERKSIIESKEEYDFLYPNLNDPNFNIKIAKKREFSETKYDGTLHDNIEEYSDSVCNAEFELAPHQLFTRNFLSFNTPYNSLLLFHGLGSGKTCSAISVAEEMRDSMSQLGITQRIIIIATPNVQENFKLQLFDDRKLELVDGLWNINACTGNKYLKEINPMNIKGLTKDKVISQIKKIIHENYMFLGYIEFANHFEKKTRVDQSLPLERRKEIIKQKILDAFENRLIIIDEVHNIRISSETNQKTEKSITSSLIDIVKTTKNVRLLLLSVIRLPLRS